MWAQSARNRMAVEHSRPSLASEEGHLLPRSPDPCPHNLGGLPADGNLIPQMKPGWRLYHFDCRPVDLFGIL